MVSQVHLGLVDILDFREQVDSLELVVGQERVGSLVSRDIVVGQDTVDHQVLVDIRALVVTLVNQDGQVYLDIVVSVGVQDS